MHLLFFCLSVLCIQVDSATPIQHEMGVARTHVVVEALYLEVKNHAEKKS